MTLNRKALVWKILLTIIMAGIGIFMFLPFIWMVSASLKLPLEVFGFPIKWIPQNPQWDNYATVWNDQFNPFSRDMLNSLFVTTLSVAGTLAVSSLAAYAFAKINFSGKRAVFLLFLATMMVPTQVTLIPRFVVINWMNIFDTHWALILPAIFYVVGIFMLRQFYERIPDELMESALIDGAGHFSIYSKIVLPLSVPALISLTILSFVRSWNDYINPLVFINTRALYTVTLSIQGYLNMMGEVRYDLAMTAAAISILPVMIMFALTQRYYIDSITSSGIKG